MRTHFAVTVPLLAILLSGCETTDGPKPILTSTGPVAMTPMAGQAKRFNDAVAAATLPGDTDGANAHVMLETGLDLVYSSCSDYFRSAGKTQQWLIATRDAVGLLTAVAAPVMVLAHAKRGVLEGSAIASGAAYSGLDLYTKNFLFAAENIDAVWTLTSKALAKHADMVRAVKQVDYGSAANAILDNQMICTPRRIASLARDAIKSGQIVADQETGLDALGDAQLNTALSQLRRALNLTGEVSQDEAGALWWFINARPLSDADLKSIETILAGLTDDADPIDATTHRAKTDWAPLPKVDLALSGLPKVTVAHFRAAIAEARAKQTRGVKVESLPVVAVQADGERLPSTHVMIRVK